MKRSATSTLKQSSKIKKAISKLNLPKPLQDIYAFINEPKRKSTISKKKLSTGTSIIFNGPKNSGKTAMATMLASQAGKELYKVDIFKLVSKYIGETEKNISTLFQLAEENDWILFFDEADALFGKRTEVKDSHDRYANLETSYLIKRFEEFNGLVILASNKKTNLDPSFARRLKYKVKFPLKLTK